MKSPASDRSSPSRPAPGNSNRYEIRVAGRMDTGWSDWLPGMRIERGGGSDGADTILRGVVPDQSALRGILCQLWDLGLTVIEVRRLPPAKREGE